MTYVVRTWDGTTDHAFVVEATDPDEALTIIERRGLDYIEAEVSELGAAILLNRGVYGGWVGRRVLHIAPEGRPGQGPPCNKVTS